MSSKKVLSTANDKIYTPEETAKLIISKFNLSGKELDPNKTYLFCLDVGDTPKDKVLETLMHIKAKFEEKNITQVIFMPIFEGDPKVIIETLPEAMLNKTLKEFLEERFAEDEDCE